MLPRGYPEGEFEGCATTNLRGMRGYVKLGSEEIRVRRLSSLSWRAVGILSFAVAMLLFSQMAAAPPAGWRQRALAYADSQGMFGLLHANPPAYNGSFVRFLFNESTAMITDYNVLIPGGGGVGTSFFQSISTLAAAAPGTVTVDSAKFAFASSSMSVLVFNNPGAAIIVRSLSVTLDIAFWISNDTDASRAGSSLNLSAGAVKARLFVTGTASIELLSHTAYALLPAGTSAIFRVDSVAGEGVAGPAKQSLLADEAVKSRLLLESSQVGLEGFVESSDIEYGGLTLVSSEMSSDGFSVSANGDFTTPKLAALYVHGSVFAANNRTVFGAKFDGLDVVKLASIEEVLKYAGSSPAYAYLTGVNGLLFVIYLPQPGQHVFSAAYPSSSSNEQGLNPIQAASIAAIVLVVIGAAAAFMWRRRKPKS